MIVINKSLHPHNSLGTIAKFVQLAQNKQDTPPLPEKSILPRTIHGMKNYRKEYNKLCSIKRNNFGLSYKSFKNKPEYVLALKLKKQTAENKELREFIEDQINGGFSYDEVSVLI